MWGYRVCGADVWECGDIGCMWCRCVGVWGCRVCGVGVWECGDVGCVV